MFGTFLPQSNGRGGDPGWNYSDLCFSSALPKVSHLPFCACDQQVRGVSSTVHMGEVAKLPLLPGEGEAVALCEL